MLEGADLITSMGSKVFKGPMFAPKKNYPWNSPAWPSDSSYASLTDVAKHLYFDELFRNPKLKVFVMIAYRAAKWSNNDYWRAGMTLADAAAEEKEFYDLTLYFLKTHAINGKTLVLEHWEGDWSMMGNYNSSNDPTGNLFYYFKTNLPLEHIKNLRKFFNNCEFQSSEDTAFSTPAIGHFVFL